MLQRSIRLSVFSGILLILWPALAMAENITIELGEDDCAAVVSHIVQDDVTFKPGQGAGGKTVAPADLHDYSAFKVPDVLQFPVTIDLAQRGGRQPGIEGQQIEMPIGVLTLKGQELYYNGYPLTSGSQADLIAACRKLKKDNN